MDGEPENAASRAELARRRRVPRGWKGDRERQRTDGGTAGGALKRERVSSAGEREGRLGCGGREEASEWEREAELEEALLGDLPGGVDGVDAPRAAAGAAQDVDSEGVLVERGPSRRRVVGLRGFVFGFGDGAGSGGGSVTVGRKAAWGAKTPWKDVR